MTNSPAIPFDFDGQMVRVVERNGSPWWIAADIAAILGYRDAPNMIRNLDKDEKGTHSVSTLGGKQDVTIISESGVYSAIFASKRKEARQFKKWVTSEVLPAIRRFGFYGAAGGRRDGALSVREQIALQKEADRLAHELMRQRQPIRKTQLHEHLVRTLTRLGSDAPTLESFDEAVEATRVNSVQDFFAALNTLSAMGVAWNLHRKPREFIAIHPASMQRMFRQFNIDITFSPELMAALQTTVAPRFVAYKSVNTITGAHRHCLIFATGHSDSSEETMQ